MDVYDAIIGWAKGWMFFFRDKYVTRKYNRVLTIVVAFVQENLLIRCRYDKNVETLLLFIMMIIF